MKSGTGDLKPAPPFFVKKSLQFENDRNGGFNYEVSDSCRRTR